MQAMCMKRENQWIGQWSSSLLALAAVLLLFSVEVYAGGSGMPWESTLDKILQSLQGPIARFAGITAIVLTGLMFALGEGGQMFKRGLGIAFGLSIAFSATTFVGQLGFAGGALL
jgi:type IV secretion system protein VirB2